MAAFLLIGADSEPQGGLRIPEELLAGVDLTEESSWMGIYINGKKIGYVHNELEPLKDGGYIIREFSRMEGSMMGASQQMRMKMDVITDSTLALVAFEGSLEAEPYSTRFKGKIDGNVLKIEITTGGKKTERFLAAPDPIYLSQAIKPLLQAGRLFEGDSLKLAGFDPMKLEMQDLYVYGAPLENHRLWGEDVLARELKTRLAGFESTVYVDEHGNTIAEYGPMGMLMRREDMEIAIDMDDELGGVDFLAMYSIKPKGRIKAPRKAAQVMFRIKGMDVLEIDGVSDRQTIVNANTGVVKVASVPQPHTGVLGNRQEYTRDAPYIESREKVIKQTAANAVMGSKSLMDSLSHLSNWVFHNVQKKPSAGLPSALSVLQNLEGDCNEHSVLFTALARSLNIPTRLMLGVVYQGGEFFYHAWVAAWVDGRWVEIDPTFGLKYADAARIAFAQGDLSNSIDLVMLLGNLEIEIVESH